MDAEQIDTTGMATLYRKMSLILSQVKRMPKNGTNQHFNYAFVKDGDVLDTIRELMAEQNLALFPEIVSYQLAGKKTQIQMMFTIACGDTGATRTMSWFGEADDGQDKGIGKAATLAEKYFLLKLFMVSTGDPTDDPDEGADGKQPRKTTNARPNGNSGQPTSQNGNLPPSSASNGQPNGKGKQPTARDKYIEKIRASGLNLADAMNKRPPPSNMSSDIDNEAWYRAVLKDWNVEATGS